MGTDENLPDFATRYVNLASVRLGAEAARATDEFFAPKERMLADEPAIFIPDKYDDHGKWMDGWETRRRRDGGRDHCIVRLAWPGTIHGLDIDTSHFTGNYPPAASIEACMSDEEPGDDASWVTLQPAMTLAGDSHHFVAIDRAGPFNWLRVNMFPDGGIARLRVYGEPYCDWSARDANAVHELTALENGGRIVAYNNAHYGSPWALLAPGRGVNMGDGWETRRRREPGNDWIIVQLGHPGNIERIEVDTAHFKGNFPESCSVQAAMVEDGTDQSVITQSMFWDELLGRQKLGMDAIHEFDGNAIGALGPISHLRLNIFPDGGVSRLRLFGRPA
ncbi:MAG: allantoicase [Proteobacteria bacterium]|nr:allantoicase [Pseudomonadota bacterium]